MRTEFLKKLINKYKKVPLPAKASLWFVVCSFLQKGISFITTPIFTRIMTSDNYGVVTMYSAWLEIIAIFATFQLATGVFSKAMIKYEKDRDGYTSSSLILASIITVCCFLIYILKRDVWNNFIGLDTAYVVSIFVDIFFSTALSLWTIRNRFEFKYKSVVVLSISLNIFGPLMSILFLSMASEAQQPLAKIWGLIVVKIILNMYLYVKILLKGKKMVDLSYWKYALRYNLPLIPHYLSQQVLSQSDRIMISELVGIAAAGIYGVAYQLSRVVFTFVLVVHQSFTPWAFENLKKQNYKPIKKYSLLIEIGIGAACLFASLFAPEFIFILGGEKYLSAIWIVPPVSMSILFQSIYTFFADIEFYYEQTKMVMVASISVSIVNVILNAVFIPMYGFVAAGYTTLVCYILYSLVHFIFMKKICKDEDIDNPFNSKAMWMVGAVYVVLAIGVSFLYNHTLMRYLSIILMTVVGGMLALKNLHAIKKLLKKQ